MQKRILVDGTVPISLRKTWTVRLAIVLALLVSSALMAGQSPQTLTVGGQVAGASSGATWQIYATTNSSLVVTGAVGTVASNVWSGDIGNQFGGSSPLGMEQMCLLSWQVNGGTIGHTGYFAVMNHTLTGDDPAIFSNMTFQPIPIPSVASDTLAHLNWFSAVQDPGEGGATNIIGYNVFRSTDGIHFSMVNTAMVTQTFYDDAIPGDQNYYYAIGLVYRGTPPANSAALSANSSSTFKNSVGDNIPDWWRQQYFGFVTPTNTSNCATCDADGTGQNNLFKYLAGLNPINPSSVFRIISLSPQGTNMAIVWQAGGGRTNIVQASSVIGSNTFNDISSPLLLPGSGDMTTNYLDIGGATNSPTRFYRIRLGP